MARERSFESLSEVFWQLEKDEALTTWKVAGVYFWVEFRTKLYYNVMLKELGLVESENGHKPVSKPEYQATINQASDYWKKVNSLPGKLKRLKNYLNRASLERSAVLPFRRRNSNGEDVLTTDLIDILPKGSLVMGIGGFDLANPGRLSFDRLKQFFLDRFKLPAFIFVKLAVSKADKAKHLRILKRLEAEFDVKLSKSVPLFSWFLRRFLLERWGFRKVFRYEGIKTLYLVSADRPSLIAAAHDVGAKVVELQHGWMSKTHMRYSWPRTDFLPYFPDEFWAWGQYWIDGVQLPANCKVRMMGANKNFNHYRDSNLSVKAKQVTVISQPFCSSQVLEETMAVAKVLPNYEFIIKPHPTENQESISEKLRQAPKLKNIRVAQRDENTLQLITESEYCFGVNSTSVFEAIALGKKVLLMNIPGWESASDAIQRGDATFLADSSNPEKFLKEAKSAKDPDYYYMSGQNLLSSLVSPRD